MPLVNGRRVGAERAVVVDAGSPEDDGPAASGAAAGSGRTGSSIVAADYQT